MKPLSEFDLSEIRMGAGNGDHPVTLPREIFDALVDNCHAGSALSGGFPFAIAREIKRLNTRAA